MKFKRCIIAFCSAALISTSFTAVFAAKGGNDINIAVGKIAISSRYGEGGYGGNVVANAVDGTRGKIYIPAIGGGTSDLVTIDLGRPYPITQVSMYKWSGKTGPYASADSTFEIYASNSWTKDQHDELTNPAKFTADDDFTKISGEDYVMNFDPAGNTGRYRYIQLKYTKAESGAQDLRLTELEVYVPADALDNEPVAVSVGKPVFSDFNSGYPAGSQLYMINDGDLSTKYHAYAATSENADIIIDLQNKYPIEMIVQSRIGSTKGIIDGIYASNDPEFSYSAIFDYNSEDDAWYLAEGEEQIYGYAFKYVKIDFITEQIDSSNSGLWDQPEITVYSTKSAANYAAALSEKTNVALGKAVVSKVYGHNSGLAALTDGVITNEFINYANAETQGEYYTVDLGYAYKITNIKTTLQYHAASVGEVQVSNDPSFASYDVMTGMRFREDHSQATNTYDNSPDCLPSEMKGYRYVRIYEPANGYGDNPWRVKEIEIYAPASEAVCENRAAGKEVTVINNSGNVVTDEYFGLLKTRFTDGDEGQEAGLANGAAIIELDYPQKIEWVEVMIRSNPGDNNKKGYNVWLSNEKEWHVQNGVQIGTVSSDPVYNAKETIRYNSNTDERYKYVIVAGYNSGECIANEIKVMSSSERRETQIKNTLEENEGTYTLTSSYDGDYEVSGNVILIIARYSGDKLSDVSLSDVKAVSGTSGSVSFSYTPGEALENEKCFGFVWESDQSGALTMKPVGEAAGIE